MATVKFKTVMRLEKLSKTTNEAPVCLRITKDRKTTYKTLIHVPPKCWNSKGQCVVHHRNAEILNAIIAQKRAQIEKETCLLTLREEDVSIKTIRKRINNTSTDFFEYSDKHCESIRQKNFCTYLRLRSILRKLREFHGKDKLPLKHIDLEFIQNYDRHLQHKVGNSRNTIAISMKFIAKIVSDMYRSLELNDSANPFKAIKYHLEPGNRQYLMAEEVVQIRDLPLPHGTPLSNAREIFIFECYSGLRISDILTLKWENIAEDTITLKMRKTDKYITIPLQNDVREILRQRRHSAIQRTHDISHEYVFDYLQSYPPAYSNDPAKREQKLVSAIGSATACINKHLKNIAKLAHIDKNISTHVGRHSFATMLLTNGNDLPVIQELMGHHDIKVTQLYAKVISRRKTEAINSLNSL